MQQRLLDIVRRPAFQRAVDALLAAALLLGSLGDILTHDGGTGWRGRVGLQLAAAAAISLPLLWRRRQPIVVLAVVFAGSVLAAELAAAHQGPFEPFVALMVCFYTVGALVPDRASIVTLAVALLAGVLPAAILHSAPGDAAPLLVWTFASWVVGRIIRSWRDRATALEGAYRELQEQRDLQAQAAVVVERGRIARELHDVIAHNVSMIVVQAGAAARVLEGDQPHVRDALDAIETTGRSTVDEMRRLLGVLRSADDGLECAPQPGLDDLDALVTSVREAGLPVTLRVVGERCTLPPALDLTAYRIAQEALTNALKHAGPAEAELVVRYEPDAVEIEVRDDGTGSGSDLGTGHGLIGMRERTALFGGRLDAGRHERGWLVRARLPLASAP
jgi:signal transduction histidine kinase